MHLKVRGLCLFGGQDDLLGIAGDAGHRGGGEGTPRDPRPGGPCFSSGHREGSHKVRKNRWWRHCSCFFSLSTLSSLSSLCATSKLRVVCTFLGNPSLKLGGAGHCVNVWEVSYYNRPALHSKFKYWLIVLIHLKGTMFISNSNDDLAKFADVLNLFKKYLQKGESNGQAWKVKAELGFWRQRESSSCVWGYLFVCLLQIVYLLRDSKRELLVAVSPILFFFLLWNCW